MHRVSALPDRRLCDKSYFYNFIKLICKTEGSKYYNSEHRGLHNLYILNNIIGKICIDEHFNNGPQNSTLPVLS